MPESRKAATSMTCQLYTTGKEVISRKRGTSQSHYYKYTQSHYLNIHVGYLCKIYLQFCFFLPNNYLSNFPLQISGIFLTVYCKKCIFNNKKDFWIKKKTIGWRLLCFSFLTGKPCYAVIYQQVAYSETFRSHVLLFTLPEQFT